MAVCPFADQSRRFDRYYPGSYVTGVPYRGVAHSTETTGLPSYSGGAVAPHFTIDPKTGVVHQHFDTARPARALEHRPGTIDTNNMRAVQVEIIAYSDKGIAARVGGLYVGDFTATHLAHVKRLVDWINAACKVKPVLGMPLKTYPASYGDNNGVRFADSAWKKFNGWCEHQNVPHNNHGDAGALYLAALMAATSTPVLPTITGDKMLLLINDGQEHTFLTDGITMRWVKSNAELAIVKYNMVAHFGYKAPVNPKTKKPDPQLIQNFTVTPEQVAWFGVIVGDNPYTPAA